MRSDYDRLVNELAVRYSRTNDGNVLSELLSLLRRDIQNTAKEFSATTRTSAEEYESFLTEAVWLACRNGSLDNFDGSSNIMQRIRFFWRRVRSREIRRQNRQMRKGTTVSLDALSDDDNHNWENCLYELVAQDVASTVAYRDLMQMFASKHPEPHVIIHLLANGAGNVEVANEFGHSEYDAAMRQKVRRARQVFKCFVASMSHEDA